MFKFKKLFALKYWNNKSYILIIFIYLFIIYFVVKNDNKSTNKIMYKILIQNINLNIIYLKLSKIVFVNIVQYVTYLVNISGLYDD